MSGRRDQLVAACDAGDQLAIRRLGWYEVHEALATWNAPRQGCTLRQLTPYAKLVGDQEPELVLDALRELAGDWRPTPGAVRGYLNAKRGEKHRVDVGRAADPAATEEALRAVAAALDAGEQPCACGFHSAQWRLDDACVLRCPSCGGLEQGQIYAVEDAGLLEQAA